MNAQYPVAIRIPLQTNRVVKILRVGRVNRNDYFVGYVVPAADIFRLIFGRGLMRWKMQESLNSPGSWNW